MVVLTASVGLPGNAYLMWHKQSNVIDNLRCAESTTI